MEDERLAKYFPPATLGHIAVPATVIDSHGRIIAWHLPGILTESRMVISNCHQVELQINNDSIDRQTITILFLDLITY